MSIVVVFATSGAVADDEKIIDAYKQQLNQDGTAATSAVQKVAAVTRAYVAYKRGVTMNWRTATVTTLYPQRKDSEARKKMYAYGATYLTEFSGIADAMARQSDAPERMVPVFKCLAIALEEDQRYDKALEICEIALARGLDDGTKTGCAGRKIRLERKQAVSK